MKGLLMKMELFLTLLALFLMGTMVIRSSTTAKAAATEPPTPLEKIKSSDNLARKKTAYASSGTAGMGIDGNTGTRWESDHGNDNEWFFVDLGAVYSVDSVAFLWEGAYAKEYQLQTSKDGLNWTTAETVTMSSIDTTNGNEVSLSTPAIGRYVKIQGIKRATIYGYSFWEMGVFGTATGETGTDYKEIKPEDETWILLVGNSLTDYNNMKTMLKNLYISSGKKARVDSIINLGQSLSYTAEQAGTKEKIINGQYDYVVMQDKTANTSSSSIKEGVDKLYPWIQEAGSIPVFYMVWALDTVIDTNEGSNVINAYTEVAKEYHALLAPCGIVWKQFWDNGENWYTDNRHPNQTGSFMVASTLYYTLTKETKPVDFTTIASNNNVSKDLNDQIQKRTCKEACIANGLTYTGEEPSEPIPDPDIKPTNVYAQIRSDATENTEKTDLRFLATISSLQYKKAGFVFSMKKTTPTLDKDDCETISTTTVYQSVTADDTKVTATELDGSDYIYACKVSDIPADYYNYNFYVRSFVETLDGEIIYSDTKIIRPIELTKRYASLSTNTAINKPGYASSNDRQNAVAGNGTALNNGYKVNNLTDGSLTTFIVSEKSDEHPWFIADLETLSNGDAKVINKVQVTWGGTGDYSKSYAAKYKVQVSDDAENWKTVAIVTDGKAESKDIVFRSVTTRYVRILVTEKGPESPCCSLYELKAYRTDTGNMQKGGDQ